MSKRGAKPGNSRKEYAEAEEHLLNIFSPLSVAEETNANDSHTAPISELQENDNSLVDPTRDNLMRLISDDSDIQSLLSSSDGNGFKGFDDTIQEYGDGTDTREDHNCAFIYGLFRNIDNLPGCRSPKQTYLVSQISSTPLAVLEGTASTSYVLTNGNLSGIESEQPIERQDNSDVHNNLAESQTDCVIYDDDNVVLLSDEHCCEIIVAAHDVHEEHDLERNYLMSLETTNGQEQINNRVSYGSDMCVTEEYEEHSEEHHVYLSDAALDQQQQQEQEQQLLLDTAEEDVNQICDSYEDDRPDICEVYDHELEEQDDDCAVNEQERSLSLQVKQVDLGGHQEQQISISSTLDNQQQNSLEYVEGHHIDTVNTSAPARTSVIPHSSTTEFPVSSTSMPNGSDNDDYDDELGVQEDRSPPIQRKYVPLLKNTLSPEAMDRRMANMCLSQPQMTLSEKWAIWNCSPSFEAVEDVENFEAVFERHEADPGKTQKFVDFWDYLQKNYIKTTHETQEQSASDVRRNVTVAPDTPYSSEDALVQKRPNYRRLLPSMPAQPTELIVLDDDDDDDDCYEVTGNPSTTTLVAKEPFLKTTQTQTNFVNCLATKETSTTDLTHEMGPTTQRQYIMLNEHSPFPEEQHLEGMQNEVEIEACHADSENVAVLQQPQNEQPQPAARASSVEYHNDGQFYEQHEFCNYLGLTELATANAVATAMRELANSTVARRSLRVRSQQQLDRMRSDVRGKRREKQQHQQREQQHTEPNQLELNQPEQKEDEQSQPQRQQQRNNQHPHDPQQQQQENLNNESTSTTYVKSNVSYTKSADIRSVSMPSATSDQFVYPTLSISNTAVPSSVGYYYQGQSTDEQPHQETSVVISSNYHTISLEAAFAKVYATAAPAQNELHECIQSRLRQARETKPSIYIVKSLNATESPKTDQSFTETVSRTSSDKKKVELPPETKPSRKNAKKVSSKTIKQRRSTSNAVFASASSQRDLVTRSTTHMNSKLLRNRKVNLLKTYELTDSQGRCKQRLSGGTAPTGKRLSTTKSVKKNVKNRTRKTSETGAADVEQMAISHASSIHSSSNFIQSPTSTKAKTPKQQNMEPKTKFKGKRSRAKSLPASITKEVASNVESSTPDVSPVQRKQSKMVVDVQDFITSNSVSPPLHCTSIRHYVNTVSNPLDQPSLRHPQSNANNIILQEQQGQQRQQQAPVGFFDLTSNYAQLNKPPLMYPLLSPPPSQRVLHFSPRARQVAGTMCESSTLNFDGLPTGSLLSLTKSSTEVCNPLAGKNGKVLYIYFELDQLIVVQEKFVSFWKFSKLFNLLSQPPEKSSPIRKAKQNAFNSFGSRKSSSDSQKSDEAFSHHWISLGGVRRPTNDIEITAPYGNRLCAHNSTPVYIEMRCHPLDHHKRESKLMSLYVNVYYYCEEELRPKMHSVHLDAVNCEWDQVIYTTIAESRYFVMAWQQDVVVGKTRAGICKYSLTPSLDTLASIREFKLLRHELKHIECLTEDRLIGYGDTCVTVWDHRSGDTLMNYDLGFQLGQNLGVLHFPSFEMDQSNLLVLYQHVKEVNKLSELRIIACELSHSTPTHRLLQVHQLPSPQFDSQLVAINTGDHVILKSPKDDEIWVSTTDPRQLTYIASQGNHRYYARQKSHIIKLTPTTLIVDSIANHILKLASEHQSTNLMGMSAASLTGSA